MQNQLTRELLAEFVGTFTLCFIGIASVVVAPVFGIVAPALGHGLILVGLIFAYGHISGAHFNPGVTLGLLVGQEIGAMKAAFYMVAQFIGGIVAAYLLLFGVGGAENPALAGFLGDAAFNYGQTTGFLTAEHVWNAALVEGVLIFFLVSAIFQSAVYGKAGNLAAVAIGLTLAACIFAAGGLTGASVNPARTLGPALAAGDLSYTLPYFVGLFGGGAVAGAFHGYLLPADPISQQEPDFPVTEASQR